jgi:hypothetical protein
MSAIPLVSRRGVPVTASSMCQPRLFDMGERAGASQNCSVAPRGPQLYRAPSAVETGSSSGRTRARLPDPLGLNPPAAGASVWSGMLYRLRANACVRRAWSHHLSGPGCNARTAPHDHVWNCADEHGAQHQLAKRAGTCSGQPHSSAVHRVEAICARGRPPPSPWIRATREPRPDQLLVSETRNLRHRHRQQPVRRHRRTRAAGGGAAVSKRERRRDVDRRLSNAARARQPSHDFPDAA